MKRIALLSMIFVLLTLFDPAYAQESLLLLPEETGKIPPVLAEQLLTDHPAAGVVRILRWIPASTPQLPANAILEEDFVPFQDVFLLTCATGCQKTLLEDLVLTAETKFTFPQGTDPRFFGNLETVDSSLSVCIPAESCYTGPEEGAPENSREYRIRWIGRAGTLSGLSPEEQEVTCHWVQPVGALVYAIDRLIVP